MSQDANYEEERLAIPTHVKHGVRERVAWRRDCRDAWQKLLLILEKYQSLPNRQQVLSRVDDERLLPRRVHLSFVSPCARSLGPPPPAPAHREACRPSPAPQAHSHQPRRHPPCTLRRRRL